MSPADGAWPAKLAELVALFDDLPRQERIDLLLEFADSLPAVPAELRARAGAGQPVHECLTPVTIYVEPNEGRPRFFIEVGETAPTISAVAAVLQEGCAGATKAEILAIPTDLPVRIIGPEMVGQRRLGLMALLHHLKRAVAEAG